MIKTSFLKTSLFITAMIVSTSLLQACGASNNAEQSDANANSPDSIVQPESGKTAEPLDLAQDGQALPSQLIERLTENHNQLIKLAAELDTQTQAFVSHPDRDTHKALTEIFTKTHQAYRISVLSSALSSDATDSRIDEHWMLPGYLDSVDGYPSSGIIHSEMPLDVATLRSEHQFSDELYLTLGFHPYEFILLGDGSSPIETWRRFANEGTDKNKKAAERRRIYLSILASELAHEITQIAERWKAYPLLDISKLNDAEIKKEYLAQEKIHSGEDTAKQVEQEWLALKTLAGETSIEQ